MKRTGTEITMKILGNEEIDGDSYTDILRIATDTAEIYGSEFDAVFEVGVEFTYTFLPHTNNKERSPERRAFILCAHMRKKISKKEKCS